MQRQGQIDYRMRRRAVLAQVRDGDVGEHDVRDAHRELLRAGRHIGRVVDGDCPVCEDGESLRVVTYVFTGRAAKSKGEGGRAVPDEKLPATVARYGDVKAYEVEVCIACHWHHLLESYWLLRDGRATG